MGDDPSDRPTRQAMPVVRDAGQSRPTVKAFPAVRPDSPSDSVHPPPGEVLEAPPGPSSRELTLALMRLMEEVERLGGDVSEVRYLLGMASGRPR